MAAEEDEAMKAALAASLGNPLPVAAAAIDAPPPPTLPNHLVETVRMMAERGGIGGLRRSRRCSNSTSSR